MSAPNFQALDGLQSSLASAVAEEALTTAADHLPVVESVETQGIEMKLKEPMIILGNIQRVELQSMTDKVSGKVTQMLQAVIMDSTKPVQFRTVTPMVMFIMFDKALATLGTVDPEELTDMQVTVAAAEVSPYNAMLKLKGQIVKGHHAGQALLSLLAPPPAATPAPVKPEPKKS